MNANAARLRALKQIGIYGGTFDPIHHAHLILAREAVEELALAEMIFVPAAQSPHKTGERAAPPELRLEMLRAAVRDEPKFSVDTCELERPAPSYTVDTVEDFRRRLPGTKIFLCLGSDNLAGLSRWHRLEELRALVEIVVLERHQAAAENSFRTIRRHLDISATEIRNRVAAGRSIRYLVPPEVEAIIRLHNLYQEPSPSPKRT